MEGYHPSRTVFRRGFPKTQGMFILNKESVMDRKSVEPEIFAATCAIESIESQVAHGGSWSTGRDGHGDQDD